MITFAHFYECFFIDRKYTSQDLKIYKNNKTRNKNTDCTYIFSKIDRRISKRKEQNESTSNFLYISPYKYAIYLNLNLKYLIKNMLETVNA